MIIFSHMISKHDVEEQYVCYKPNYCLVYIFKYPFKREKISAAFNYPLFNGYIPAMMLHTLTMKCLNLLKLVGWGIFHKVTNVLIISEF